MSVGRKLVEAFYLEVWNRRDHNKARAILTEDFAFRGSLGDQKSGVAGFIDYMEAVHTALSDYECIINRLVVSDEQVAAQMTFRGYHQGAFFGFDPTGKCVEWSGAAFFEIQDARIRSLWVLGDVDAIKMQLSGHLQA